MPVGLDGNPDPVVTPERTAVLDAVSALVESRHDRRTIVGVDGRSGSGKSTFSDELASRLEERGLDVVRSTTDSFHRPRVQRLSAGPSSPDGYYRDSHQLDRMAGELLVPFKDGSPRVLVAAFDEPSDTTMEVFADVAENAVLVFDGLFLQRPELCRLWDVSVYLDADVRRDAEWLDFVLADLPDDPVARAGELDRRLERARWPRYRKGWDVYLADADPRRAASLVVDNNDFANPRIVASRSSLGSSR
jgi:uridine kinase